MYTKRLLIMLLCWLFILKSGAQQVKESIAEVDGHSLNLYNAAQWKALLIYGKENIAAGNDFPLLRMRTGYAAFMLGNFSQSLLQYKKAYDADADNIAALYYVYLNNLYLNNITAARYYAAKLPAEIKAAEKIDKVKLSSFQTEFSYKRPNDSTRKNAQYGRVGLNVQLGYKLELQQSGAFFKQEINEPALVSVINNRRIPIDQKEYYGKLIVAATGNLSLIGGFHYLNTRFNNLVFDNTIAFAGIQYNTPFVHVKAMAHFATLSNLSFTQYDGTVSLYPLGNTTLYSITRGAYGDDFTLSQIIGYGITKKIWLEGNVTFGKFLNLFENDALFVYNDIDTKQFKAGGSVYASLSKKLLLSLNYTFEQKLKFFTINNTFYQHSINGGLTWNF